METAAIETNNEYLQALQILDAAFILMEMWRITLITKHKELNTLEIGQHVKYSHYYVDATSIYVPYSFLVQACNTLNCP